MYLMVVSLLRSKGLQEQGGCCNTAPLAATPGPDLLSSGHCHQGDAKCFLLFVLTCCKDGLMVSAKTIATTILAFLAGFDFRGAFACLVSIPGSLLSLASRFLSLALGRGDWEAWLPERRM